VSDFAERLDIELASPCPGGCGKSGYFCTCLEDAEYGVTEKCADCPVCDPGCNGFCPECFPEVPDWTI